MAKKATTLPPGLTATKEGAANARKALRAGHNHVVEEFIDAAERKLPRIETIKRDLEKKRTRKRGKPVDAGTGAPENR